MNARFCIPILLTSLFLVIGCGEATDSNVPPVLTAMDEMEAITKAREEAKMEKLREEVRQRQAEQKANGELDAGGPGEPSLGEVPASGQYVVDFETTVGNFTVEVTREWAPRGAQRFYELVKDKFFDNAGFFRVVPGFMVQFGLAANPELTAKWDINIQDDPVIESNQPGYVTFAKTGAPNSRSTQIFINYGDNARLDGQGFAPFGKVTKGMDVVRKISSAHREDPDQGSITQYGNSYLKSKFPELDYVTGAKIVSDDLAASPSEDEEGAAAPVESESAAEPSAPAEETQEAAE